MEKLLAGKRLPTAVMCSNDMTRLEYFTKVYRAQLRVPDNLSVIGFDDIHMARVTIPPSPQSRCPAGVGGAAVTALRAHVESTVPHREYKIDTHLVVRNPPAIRRARWKT